MVGVRRESASGKARRCFGEGLGCPAGAAPDHGRLRTCSRSPYLLEAALAAEVPKSRTAAREDTAGGTRCGEWKAQCAADSERLRSGVLTRARASSKWPARPSRAAGAHGWRQTWPGRLAGLPRQEEARWGERARARACTCSHSRTLSLSPRRLTRGRNGRSTLGDSGRARKGHGFPVRPQAGVGRRGARLGRGRGTSPQSMLASISRGLAERRICAAGPSVLARACGPPCWPTFAGPGSENDGARSWLVRRPRGCPGSRCSGWRLGSRRGRCPAPAGGLLGRLQAPPVPPPHHLQVHAEHDQLHHLPRHRHRHDRR